MANASEPEADCPARTINRKNNGLDPLSMQNSSVNLCKRYLAGINNLTPRMRYNELYARLRRTCALNEPGDNPEF